MTPEERDRLTKVEADVTHMQRTLDEVRRDLKTVLVAIDQAKGGWKVIAFQLGLSGLTGAIVGWFAKGAG